MHQFSSFLFCLIVYYFKGNPRGGKLNFTHDCDLCVAHRASDVNYSFPVTALGLTPGWYTFVLISTESKWSHGFKKGGCGGCSGGITEISVNGVMFQRLDKISVQGLKGQWTEAAIPFEVKAGDTEVRLSLQTIHEDPACPCHYPYSLCGLRIHTGATGNIWGRTGGMRRWRPQLWQGDTWIYAINVAGSYLLQGDGLLWSQDYGNFYPPLHGYTGDHDITYGTAGITCGSDYNYPLGCVPPYVGAPDSLRGIDPWIWNWGRQQVSFDYRHPTFGTKRFNLTYKLPVPSDGKYTVFLFYYAVAGDGWPAANTYFEVEFGQCNDQRHTGASFKMGKNICNTSFLEPCVLAFTVDSRDKMITMHFIYNSSRGQNCPQPSYGDACWADEGHHPGVRGIMVKADNGIITPKLAPNVIYPYQAYSQPTCTSDLVGNYPNYEWRGAQTDGWPTVLLPTPPPAPTMAPPPTNSPPVNAVPTDPAPTPDPCLQYNDNCKLCLESCKNTFCPTGNSRGPTGVCGDSVPCTNSDHVRTASCEDSNDQIIKVAPIDSVAIIQKANTDFGTSTFSSNGVIIVIISVMPYTKHSNNTLTTRVIFNVTGPFTNTMMPEVLTITIGAFANGHSINVSRINGWVTSLSKKRQSQTGETLILVDEAPIINDEAAGDGGLSGGAVAGIVIGVLAILIILIVIIALIMYTKNSESVERA